MIGIFIVLSGLFLAPLFQPAHAASSCTTPANRIVAENLQPGNPPSEWAITNSDPPAHRIKWVAWPVWRSQPITGRHGIRLKAASAGSLLGSRVALDR